MPKVTLKSIYFNSKKLNISFPYAVTMRKEYLISFLTDLTNSQKAFNSVLRLLPTHDIKKLLNNPLTELYVEPYISLFEIEHWADQNNLVEVEKIIRSGLEHVENQLFWNKEDLESLSKIDYTREYENDEVDIVDLKYRLSITQVAQDLGLTRIGPMWFSVYKEERTPSMKLYESSNSFYCFAMAKGGDVVDLVMARQNINFNLAVKYLQQY